VNRIYNISERQWHRDNFSPFREASPESIDSSIVAARGDRPVVRPYVSGEGDSQMNTGQHWQKFDVGRPRPHAEDQL
jgi:hypothetical protein